MTNSLGKKTNGGLLRYIDLIWRAGISRRWKSITRRKQNETL